MKKNTAEYILEKVAPIFNKKGYVGTSLSDLTKATGFTKGALYCNFLNKEDLAVKSFRLNVKKTITPLSKQIEEKENSIEKLKMITSYYRNYHKLTEESGGCPVLNVSIDSKYNNPILYEAAKGITAKLVKSIEVIIENGKNNNEIKKIIDAEIYAKNIYAMIEGGIFLAYTQDDGTYLELILDYIENKMLNEMKM